MIGQWEKLFTPSTPFLMTPSSGESIGLAALRIMRVFQSEPLIDVCLARLPKGETNPLSARSRSSETKFVAKIGVGLLPFISTASVWQKGRPVATDCAAYRRQLTIDTKSCRTEMLGDLTANYNGIPRSYYRFGASWPHVRETLLVIQEQDGDPFAVMMPTTEIIRFYYAPSTRLAQALFWGGIR